MSSGTAGNPGKTMEHGGELGGAGFPSMDLGLVGGPQRSFSSQEGVNVVLVTYSFHI